MGGLESTIPPHSAPAWTSLFTGKNPGKHGVFGFIDKKFEEGEISFIKGRQKSEDILWNILGKKGKKVIIINVPLTYPPVKVNGIMISGFLTPGEHVTFTYPEKLGKMLIKKYNYKIEPDNDILYSENDVIYLNEVKRITEVRTKVALDLMKSYEWDFFCLVYSQSDRLQHRYWHLIDNKSGFNPIKDYYILLDGCIGKLLEELDSNTYIIMVSDHGFCSQTKTVFLNRWLLEREYLKIKKQKRIEKKILKRIGLTKEKLFNVMRLLHIARISKRIPKSIKKHIPHSGENIADIDMQSTKAFFLPFRCLYINEKSKEFKEKLIKEIYDIKDPETEEKIIDKIFEKKRFIMESL